MRPTEKILKINTRKINAIKRRRLQLYNRWQRVDNQEKVAAIEKSRIVHLGKQEGLNFSHYRLRPMSGRDPEKEAAAWEILNRKGLSKFLKGHDMCLTRDLVPKKALHEVDNLIGLIVWWLEIMEKRDLLDTPLRSDPKKIPTWSPFWIGKTV